MDHDSNPALRVTHKTIAAAAGVSRPTVSKALHGDETIPEATSIRIREIATKLGYQPHPVVSTLMTQLRKIRSQKYVSPIAFLTTSVKRFGWKTSTSYAAYYDGAARRCNELGFKLENFWFGDVERDGKRLSRILRTRGIRGVLIGGGIDPRLSVDLAWNDFAAAAFGYRMKNPSCDRATSHQYRNFLRALRRLDELGYRRIGLAVSRFLDEGIINSYLAAYSVYQTYIPKRLRVPHYNQADVTKDEFRSWLQKHRPDVVVTTTWEVFDWCREWGLDIPGDVAVTVLGLDPKNPGWAGIDQNSEEVGAAAVDLIVEQIYNNRWGIQRYHKVVMIEGEWVDGWTVDCNRPLSPSIDWLDFS